MTHYVVKNVMETTGQNQTQLTLLTSRPRERLKAHALPCRPVAPAHVGALGCEVRGGGAPGHVADGLAGGADS